MDIGLDLIIVFYQRVLALVTSHTGVANPYFFSPYIKVLLTPGPWQLAACFLSACFLMITRLNAVEKNGFEGTIVGTLVMPYFSGFPNLCFAYLMAKSGNNGHLVLENCLVNNVTNLTLILALPALLWEMNLFPETRGTPQKTQTHETKINYLSLLLSLLALIFFTAALWQVGRDGVINAGDGWILVGLFLFWQIFHLFEVLKTNTRKDRKIKPRIFIDLAIIGICAWAIFSSINGLVEWINLYGRGLFAKENIGILSGFLMVLPNGFLAVYYAAVHRADIAYSSQIGDCHICIPLCIGVFALLSPIHVPSSFETAVYCIMGAGTGLFFLTAFFGKLPRWAGVILMGLYGVFIFKGIIL
jgi:cation:H+ antiporter